MTASSVPNDAAVVPGTRLRDRVRPSGGWFGLVSVVVAVSLAALGIVPLLRVLVRLFWVDGSLTLAPVREALAVPDVGTVLGHTLIAVGASSVLAFVIGASFAWLNERTDARMGIVTDALPLLPFLLPPVAGAVGWVILLSPRAGLVNAWLRDLLGIFGYSATSGPFDIHSWYGLVGVYAIYQVPFVFLMVSAGLKNMDASLEEQSRISGAGLVRTLRRVTLPALAPSLGAAVLLTLWLGFGIFSLPAIIGSPAGIEVLSVRIVNLLRFTFPPQTGAAVGLSGFVVLFVGLAYVLQRRILRNSRHATIGGKGTKVRRIELGRWRWPLRAVMAGYVLIATVLPVVALVLVSLNGFWTPNIDWGSLDFDALRTTVFEDRITRRAIVNSLTLGVVGGFIGIVAAAVVALWVARRGTRFTRVVDGAVKFPAAISNLVVAVGVLLVFAAPPFRLSGTVTILLLGYLALYMPQGSVAADAAVSQVGKELPEASAISGAGPGRTFRKIYLPLMTPGLVAGWTLLFIRMAGDLTASAILAGTNNPVVGFRILESFQGGSYALLAALSTVLVTITAAVLVVVLVYTRRRARWGIESKLGGV